MLVTPPHTKRRILRSKSLLIASALALAASASAIAEELPAGEIISQVAALNTQPIVERPNLGSTFVNGARPDVSALRYYAVRGEQQRVQSEIRRLKGLYPNWKQPENIFADDSGEEKPLWDLYAKGDISTLKAKMSEMAKQVAGYVPSHELISKLEQRENRSVIANSWKSKDWDGVIASANANPGLLTGDDIEVIWFVAEAYAQKERPQEATEAFGAALAIAKSAEERRATMQKAAILLTSDQALSLLRANPTLAQDKGLVGETEDAIIRGALARSAELGVPFAPKLKERVEKFSQRVIKSGSQTDAVLLAWSNFGQSNWADSLKWFEIAMKGEKNVKATEGAIMSAMRLGDLAKASSLANAWRDTSPEIGALFISIYAPNLLQTKPVALDPEFLATYAAKTSQLKNGEGAEALGWYAYNVAQLDAARAWFGKAIAWEETETAAFGAALTEVRAKNRTAFSALQVQFGGKYEKVAKLKYTVAARKKGKVRVSRRSRAATQAGRLRGRIAKLQSSKQFGKCLQESRRLRQFGPLKSADHEMRGWCLMGAKRPAEAERAFAAAVARGGKSTNPSAYGRALASLRAGKTNLALTIANSSQLTKKQRRVIDLELLTQRARAAFANQDYAAVIHALDSRAKLTPEPRDLTVMRGWAHYNTGRLNSAHQIFALIDQQLSTRDSRRGLQSVTRKMNEKVDGG